MLLNDEQRMMAETAHDFALNELRPHTAEWDRESRFPAEALTKLGALGFMGLSAPPDYDGVGADMVSNVAVMERLAWGDGSVSTIVAVHNSVGYGPILRFGTEDQKHRFVPPMARGEMLGGFGLTEPQAGSDASALKTRARRDGNKWVLNGVKHYITSGGNADLLIVFAVTDPDAGKHGISAFIVPTDSPGYRVASVEKKLGQRASDTCQIAFEDLELTPDLLLGEEGQGYKIALSNLEGGRVGIAAQAVGMAQAALEHAVAYAKERESMGKPIIEHQAVGFRLAEAAARLEAARQLTYHAAALRDAGRPCLTEASMAKMVASDTAEQVVSDALQTFGGAGYLQDYPVEQIYRDVRVTRIYEGTSDIQKMVVARSLAA
ncbi:MAG: acyl-CoA dehydrogenase family protein [Alphaproteobacteria bacterium]|nr:acyl-CoA dehydrogenase family protein [Alphaproteobacteria bacterium]